MTVNAPQPNPTEEPSSNKTPPLAYTILRIVGIIAALHAAIGLVFGLSSLYFIPGNIDPSMLDHPEFQEQIEEAIQSLPKSEQVEARNLLDVSQMVDLMNSQEFRQFFYGLTLFGIIFNGCLAYVGSRLFQYHFSSIGPFVLLMLCFAFYFFILPMIINSLLSPDNALKFAGTWPIGNAGLGMMLVTYFWFWAPLLVLFVGRYAPKTS